MFNALRGRADFRSADTLDAPLRELVERGYIREANTEKANGAGRPPSPRYDVRP